MAGNQKVKRNARVFNPIQDTANQYDREVVAKPVDTFVQHKAMENAGARYRSLALGFRDFLPAANAFLKRKFDEKVAKEEAQGEKLYYETGSQRLSWEDFREKEDERLRKAGISTSVRNGYLKARMANEANVFKESLYNAYNSGEARITMPDGTEIPVAESDDPAVFTKWAMGYMNSYIRDNMGEDADPEYFSKIFVPQMEQTLNEVTAKHISERNAVLKDRAIKEQNALVRGSLENLVDDDGKVTTDAKRAASAVASLQSAMKELQKNGVGTDLIKEALFKQVYGMAMANAVGEGEKLLHILSDVSFPDGTKFSDSYDMLQKISKGAEEVEYMRFNVARRAKQNQQDAEREARDTAMFELYRDYLWKGEPVPPEKMLEFAESIGVQDLSQLVSMSQNIAQGWFPSRKGPELGYGPYGDMTEKQFKRASEELKRDILFDLMNGSIPTKEQLYAMSDFMTDADRKEIIKQIDEFHKGNNKLMNDIRPAIEDILSAVSASDPDFTPFNIDSTEGANICMSAFGIMDKIREQMQGEGKVFSDTDPNFFVNRQELINRFKNTVTPDMYALLSYMGKSNCTVDNVIATIQTDIGKTRQNIGNIGNGPYDEPVKAGMLGYMERLTQMNEQAHKLRQLMTADTGGQVESHLAKGIRERVETRKMFADEPYSPPSRPSTEKADSASGQAEWGYKPMPRPTGKPKLDRWSKDVTDAAKKYGIPEALIYGTMLQESGGHMLGKNGKTLTSSAGALGLMQLMPATAKGLGVNPHNPRENIMGGAKYLRQMLDMFNGDVEKAAWAYNAGPAAVKRGRKPKETQGYIPAIVANYRRFSQA